MALPLHPLSMAATDSKETGPVRVPAKPGVKPMSGSRRKAIYNRQGGKGMSPTQRARYEHKVAKNGYIPKAPKAGDNGGHSST